MEWDYLFVAVSGAAARREREGVREVEWNECMVVAYEQRRWRDSQMRGTGKEGFSIWEFLS